MKLKTVETPITSSGNLQMKGFQIAASAKAFRILSSNLYKNKIRAIIRELSCNAIDGHIANGNKGNFDVQIPSMLDPQFKIRDYGCGMDDETIMNLYTTYFASTKSDSNDYIGALGLGSKSPFSYTDSFTVVSFFDGVRRMYSAFIKDGEPTITKVSEQETDEPNGIEITLPVNPNDINRWRSEAQYVYSSFTNIKPNLSNKNIEIDYLSNDDWFIVNQKVHGYGVFAVMGNIVYPLPSEYWNNSFIDIAINHQTSYQRNSCYIRFDLGELDITPSREELSLDDETVANIKAKIKSVSNEMSVEVDNLIKESDNIRTLYSSIHEKYRSSGYWNYVLNSSTLMKTGNTPGKERDLRTKFVLPKLNTLKDAYIPIMRYDLSLTNPRGKKQDYYSMGNIAKLDNKSISVFVNDKKSAAIRTMKGLQILKKFTNYFAYSIDESYADVFIKELKTCWKDHEIEVFYSSKCDDARKANPSKKKATTYARPKNGISLTQTSSQQCSIYAKDIKEMSGFWIPMYANCYVTTDNKDSSICGDDIIQSFMKMRGIKEVPVIKSSHWEFVQKNPNMTEIWTDMVQFVLDHESKLVEDIFPHNNSTNFIITKLRNIKETKFISDKLERVSPTTEFYKIFETVLTNNYSFRELQIYKDNKDKLEKMLTKFRELSKIVTQKGNDLTSKFEAENPLICFYLSRNYGDLHSRYVKNIIETVKL